jgi:Transglycosylase SLT domain
VPARRQRPGRHKRPSALARGRARLLAWLPDAPGSRSAGLAVVTGALAAAVLVGGSSAAFIRAGGPASAEVPLRHAGRPALPAATSPAVIAHEQASREVSRSLERPRLKSTHRNRHRDRTRRRAQHRSRHAAHRGHHGAAAGHHSRHRPRRHAQRRHRSRQRHAAAVPAASPREIAAAMLPDWGWDASQFSCLDALWNSESGWNPYALNSSSGAYGIPQALPASKMASAGADWQTNPATQIRWGLGYIAASYGSPCGAWEFKQANGWY